MKTFLYGLVFVALVVPASLLAAVDTVNVPSDFGVGEGSLNSAVSTAITAGTLSSTVFKLALYGEYILNATITVPAGQHLTIVGPPAGTDASSALAMIIWTASSAPNKNFNFDCFGDITLKNVWIEYVDVSQTQVTSSLEMEDDPNADASGKGEVGVFDGVIFDYSACPANASGAVGVTAAHFKGTFRNCYFRNCTDTHLRYYGRAVSFPYNTTGWHIDTLTFENTTFANMGYVYMQEGQEYGDYVSFNHCTFLNSMEFTLESGWWHWLSVTNSVYVNAYMLGDIQSQRGTAATYPNGGAINIDSISTFGFTVPFAEADRHVLFVNNSYYIEPWLSNYMAGGNTYSDTASAANKPVPQPMMSVKTRNYFNDNVTWPYFRAANLHDSTNPGFILEPTNQVAIERYLLFKWTTNADTNWTYDPASEGTQSWPLSESLTYTNGTLKTAGMNGFPLGDLYNWWSSKYASWSTQQAAEHQRITQWQTTGNDPGVLSVTPHAGVPGKFELSQNYPNPFNPTTQIEYSVPQSGSVSLVVYNVLGEKVATLFEGVQHPGNYSVTLDGTRMASGVYFYRLQSEQASITRKLVLLK